MCLKPLHGLHGTNEERVQHRLTEADLSPPAGAAAAGLLLHSHHISGKVSKRNIFQPGPAVFGSTSLIKV